MARGGGFDLTSLVILGAAGYAAYKGGLLCNLWPGAPCPSGSTPGGGCTPACVAPQVCQGSQCVTPGGGGGVWSVTNLAIYFLESVQPVKVGGLVDALVSFLYTGPGGNVGFGFSAVGAGCSATLLNNLTFPLAAASSPTQGNLYTNGLVWPACAACGSGLWPFEVTPFVTAGGVTFWGPVYRNGVLTC